MNILFLGTFSPPITGQSLAFEASYYNYKGPKWKINKTPRGRSFSVKLITHLVVTFKLLSTLLFKRVDKVYMTCFSTIEGSISDVLVLLLCHCFRKKVVVHLQGSNFKAVICDTSAPYRWILLRLYERVDCAIVLLDSMRDQFSFFLPSEKIKVVSNFYDPALEPIPENYREDRPLRGALKVGYFSNLIYSKGIMHITNALEPLFQLGAEVELYVGGKYMGDEYMTEEDVKAAFEEKLRKFPQITYYGVTRGEEKLQFYKNIDVFALPTFYLHEAQPLSIIEAMRAGCIVISTDYKYIPDLISSENGFLVQPRSASELTESIRHILENRESFKHIQNHNIKIAESRYSQKVYLNDLYSILLKN